MTRAAGLLSLLSLLAVGCVAPVTEEGAEPVADPAAPASPRVTEAPAEPAPAAAPPPVEPQPLSKDEATALGVGGLVSAMGFDALVPHGELQDLHALAREGALVVVLTSLRCPVARLYAPGVAELAARHPQARFLVVGVAARDTPEDLRAAAGRHGWTLVTHDLHGAWVQELQAQRTTECFVIDRQGVLRYRGAIDDQYGQGYRRAEPRHRYLEDALQAVLAGEPVAVPATSAPGCVVVAPLREAAR